MSKNSKIIMWAVIIIVIVLLGWWYFASSSAPALPSNAGSAPVSETSSQTGAAINSSTSMASNGSGIPVAGLTTSPSDTSNTALNSDMASVDTQQSGLNGDSSNIDQSMNSNTN